MKRILTLVLFFLIFNVNGGNSLKRDSFAIRIHEDSLRINELEILIKSNKEEILRYREDLLNRTIGAYQLTNDRINSQLNVLGVIATIFGVLMTMGGVLIGYQSIRVQRRGEAALREVEGAKKFINSKKKEFINSSQKKLEEVTKEYKSIMELFKNELNVDIDKIKDKVRKTADDRTREINGFTIEKPDNSVIERLEKRIQLFEEIGIPDDPDILLSKAKLLSKKEMHVEAVDLLERAKKLSPNNSVIFWQLGWELSKLKNTSSSIIHYRRSIELDPENKNGRNSLAYNNIGVQLNANGHYNDALIEYQRAIDLYNTYPLFRVNKAKVLRRLRRYDEGLKCLDPLIQENTKDRNTYLEALIQLRELKNHNLEIMNVLDKAISNVDENRNQFIEYKAAILKQNGQQDEAILLYEKIADGDRVGPIKLQIAEIYFEKGEVEKAYKEIDIVIATLPEFIDSYIKKAEFQFKGNKKLEARKTIEDSYVRIGNIAILQAGGRLFANEDDPNVSKKFYLEVASHLRKILETKFDEAKIIEYYETLLILEQFDEALNYDKTRGELIREENLLFVHSVLRLVLDIMLDSNFAAKPQIINIGKQFQYIDPVTWNFGDIYAFLKKRNLPAFHLIEILVKFIRREINLPEFESSLGE